jgi:hypothetical protein
MTDQPANVVPLHRPPPCSHCGGVGKPVEVCCPDDRSFTIISICDSCRDKCALKLARVMPVFEAMLACGASREVANEAMSFLLNAMDAEDGT